MDRALSELASGVGGRVGLIPPIDDNGCTGWFNGWFGRDWTACCIAHDEAFATGTTFAEFVTANLDLGACVLQRGAPFAAILMVAACSTIGAVFFFLGTKRPKQR